MDVIRLLMAMRGDYIGEPSKGGLFFAREMAFYLNEYMEVYLIGEDKRYKWGKGFWRGKTINGKDFPFFDPYYNFPLPLGRPLDTFFYLHLVREKLRSLEPDIIYLQEMDFLPLSGYPKPAVLHIHGCFKEMLALGYPPLWEVRRFLPSPRVNYLLGLFRLRLLKRYLPLLSKIFISTNSKQIAYLKEKEPAIGAKLLPVPLIIDSGRFQPMERRRAREILGLPQEYFIILFVGGLDPLKSPPLLLQSYAKFKKLVPKSLLIFVGQGSLEELLHRQREKLGLTEDVLFMGRVPNERLPLFYNASDVFVLPSLYEGISMVALEALACGTPIVVTDAIGASEFIREGVQGFIVKRANVEAIVEALWKATKFEPETRELCREVALQFSREKVGKFVYENLLPLLSE